MFIKSYALLVFRKKVAGKRTKNDLIYSLLIFNPVFRSVPIEGIV